MYMSSYYYMCVLVLLYMCPHTTVYALRQHTHTHTHTQRWCVDICMCRHMAEDVSNRHTTAYVYICMRRHKAAGVSNRHTTAYVFVILLHMRAHTYACAGIWQRMSSIVILLHTRWCIYVSSYCYICVLILLYTCPHTTAMLGTAPAGDLAHTTT